MKGFVQVAATFMVNVVQVATCTQIIVQAATCISVSYKLQHVQTVCTCLQLMHTIYVEYTSNIQRFDFFKRYRY